MAKKTSKEWLIMPQIHSTFHNEAVETAFLNKAREIIAPDADLNFILLSGNYFSEKGYAYSAIRAWRGAMRPGSDSKRKPLLDATFACLSVYLSSLVGYSVDYFYAFDEIKEILMEKDREDLWEIISEKLPFVPLPPSEMLPEGLKSPVSPYFTIKSDNSLVLGELYQSVHLSQIVKNLQSRYFCFFSWEGYTAFGFFDTLPVSANFGFDEDPAILEGDLPDAESIIKFLDEGKTIKDLFVALIEAHNASLLEQYLIPDYESLLNRVLEMDAEDV
ncbi:MAG TPA: hypothetical protein VKK79_19590 [Candidatus Lokiarchaeia archaeon]|nr:hypothetical protein [Candidatus Lokiarchaeia archaeon]